MQACIGDYAIVQANETVEKIDKMVGLKWHNGEYVSYSGHIRAFSGALILAMTFFDGLNYALHPTSKGGVLRTFFYTDRLKRSFQWE